MFNFIVITNVEGKRQFVEKWLNFNERVKTIQSIISPGLSESLLPEVKIIPYRTIKYVPVILCYKHFVTIVARLTVLSVGHVI